MEMAESMNGMQKNVSESLDDNFKVYRNASILEKTTEDSFYNVTILVGNAFFDNYKQNENASLHSDNLNFTSNVQNVSMSVYYAYSSELIWFGAISCILFSILGTAGNFISILALSKCERLRNATTAFIVNLCVSDMFYCCFTIPLHALTLIERNWYYGDALCKVVALLKFSNGMMSIFTVVAITINRYILIVHPKIYPLMYSIRNTGISIACLWFLPLILISLPLFNVWGTLKFKPKVGDCGIGDLNGKSPRTLIFVLIIVLPAIMFIACYLKIYFVVKNSIGSKQREGGYRMPECNKPSGRVQIINNFQKSSIRVELRDKKEFRVLRIVLVIFIFYIFSIVPISVMKLLKKEKELHVINMSTYVLYFSASVVNPILYVVMSREYRKAYKELFLWKNWCY